MKDLIKCPKCDAEMIRTEQKVQNDKEFLAIRHYCPVCELEIEE